jgi:integrase
VARLYETKNGEVRGVPLSWDAVDILTHLPVQSDAEGERVGRVFPDLTPEALKRSFIRACERAGVEDFRFHDLRHEATSRLFETQKFNVMEVASITGHKTLAMLKRYTHLAAEDLAKRM